MKKIKLSEALSLKDTLKSDVNNEYNKALKMIRKGINSDSDQKSLDVILKKANELADKLISLKEDISILNQHNPWYLKLITLGKSTSNNNRIYELCELQTKANFLKSRLALDSSTEQTRAYKSILGKIDSLKNRLTRFNDTHYVKI